MSADWTTSPGFDRSKRSHTAVARRRYDELEHDPATLVGRRDSISAKVAEYKDVARKDGAVAAASAPILAVEVVEQVAKLVAAYDHELAEARAHQQSAVHSMQRQERRADEGDAVIGRLIWALTSGDDQAVEAAAAGAVHHLLGPSRLIDRSVREFEARADARRAAAALAEQLAAAPVAELVAVTQ